MIQTIGRAARHLQGRAILYAGSITGSMQRANEETDHRRQAQVEFNLLYGITKVITDVMDDAYSSGKLEFIGKVTEGRVHYRRFTSEQATKQVKKVWQEMHKAARNLEFEQAAKLRDQIHVLRQIELGLPLDSLPGTRPGVR